MSKLLKKIKCFFFGHNTKVEMTADYGQNWAKVKCVACGESFCQRYGDKNLLPWDADFEECLSWTRKLKGKE